MKKLIFLGYGNPARGDDALGPELLSLVEKLKVSRPGWNCIGLVTDFQLQIEHAMDLQDRDLACFVDASVSSPAPYRFVRLCAERDQSYTSHAMSPAAVLHVYEQINHHPAPPSFLLSIRGERFGLGEPITESGKRNLAAAFELTRKLCEQPSESVWQGYSKL